LRWFGARIGQGVVLKPRINIKYPWRLSIGDHTWIGEGAWIDNLERVDIAENVCVSQAACILTGNHDYRDEAFALEAASVQVEQGAWLGAFTVVCPGVRVARGTVLTVGSILARDSEPEQVYRGNPAARVRPRYRAGEGDVASPATRSIRMRA
jgi:putative colanic acid biosynthesis acetyltransferase WcaF